MTEQGKDWQEDDYEEKDQDRECSESCAHYDSLNQCCWQATEKGLCFHVSEGDYCHLGYKENDGR
jgi:hypothetical protein